MSWEQVMDSGLSYYLLVTVLLCFSSFLNGMSTVSLRSGGAYGSHIAQNRGCKYIEFDLVSVHNGNENGIACGATSYVKVSYVISLPSWPRKERRAGRVSLAEEKRSTSSFGSRRRRSAWLYIKTKEGSDHIEDVSLVLKRYV
jgi:hypothetical protein